MKLLENVKLIENSKANNEPLWFSMLILHPECELGFFSESVEEKLKIVRTQKPNCLVAEYFF